jgi:hypothetical protein
MDADFRTLPARPDIAGYAEPEKKDVRPMVKNRTSPLPNYLFTVPFFYANNPLNSKVIAGIHGFDIFSGNL